MTLECQDPSPVETSLCPRWRNCESIYFPRKWWEKTGIFHAKSYAVWGEKVDFLPNIGELYFPAPSGLKIQEYFHSLWSVGSQRHRIAATLYTRHLRVFRRAAHFPRASAYKSVRKHDLGGVARVV